MHEGDLHRDDIGPKSWYVPTSRTGRKTDFSTPRNLGKFIARLLCTVTLICSRSGNIVVHLNEITESQTRISDLSGTRCSISRSFTLTMNFLIRLKSFPFYIEAFTALE